jgi:ATP-dependent exoDNAse (exonuclease V) alpha subunit
MRAFLDKLNPDDRVLVMGDTRQHQSVDAGRPFQQMQEAGMQTSQLDRIMRQKDPALLNAVQHLVNNETERALRCWPSRAVYQRLQNGQERIAAIAKDYAARPENTIIVYPDNKSRQQINEGVRGELLRQSTLAETGSSAYPPPHATNMTNRLQPRDTSNDCV